LCWSSFLVYLLLLHLLLLLSSLQEVGRDMMRGVTPDQLIVALCVHGRSFELARSSQPLRVSRGNMKTITRYGSHFCSPMWPTTPTYLAWLKLKQFIYYIMKWHMIDATNIWTDKIFKIASSKPTVVGTAKPLAFPSLIKSLCKDQGVVIPGHPMRKLRRPITMAWPIAKMNWKICKV